MDIYGNKLGNHALPNIFLSFCPSLSPVDTLDVITLKWLFSVTMVRRRHMHSLECCRYIFCLMTISKLLPAWEVSFGCIELCCLWYPYSFSFYLVIASSSWVYHTVNITNTLNVDISRSLISWQLTIGTLSSVAADFLTNLFSQCHIYFNRKEHHNILSFNIL